MSDLNKLKELALIWSRSDVACMPLEEFADVTQTPMEDARVMFGAANALDEVIERLEAAEKRMAELESDNASLCQTRADLSREANSFEAELVRRDKEAGEPVAWLVLNSSDGYIERNPEAVAFLEAAGLTKCKPPYTAATPAALPPETDAATMREIGEYEWFVKMDRREAEFAAKSANWMREQAKALGVKPLRVKLPEFSMYGSIGVAQYVNELIGALKAQGIEVEE